MKKLILFTLLLLPNSAALQSCDPPIISEPPCVSSFWTHTYGAMSRFADPPARTNLRHRCVSVRGQVESVSSERDGDKKIKLRVFPTNFKPNGPYYRSDLLNKFNDQLMGGRLVVEIVCAGPVIDRNNHNAINACMNYTNPVYVPRVGENVLIIGELVTDTGPSAANPVQDHGWKEIHPVTSIRKISIR
jgi:hypothetical protein